MAKQTITRIISDLSGEVLEEGQGETIAFGFGKKSYTIDLTQSEADEFRKTIHKYSSVATEEVARLPRTSGSSAPKSPKEDLTPIREWAKSQGLKVSDRGRVSAEVMSAYHAAH
ncbi:histone-like nucleoid-structuring protein Lsr2 [Arthrobacter cavernae]|uniref:Lsr2 family protein n=1 Tax=Arthrobacter cavernae TaxID=2817681 RepID=A0A939HFT3_9MICC|nr:Lsr2 family protein [Arthrobacter cavernae]MBO1267101.1 Lsr2 family protein [Arthrobacter cavernae]